MTCINLIPAEIRRAAVRRVRLVRWSAVTVLAGVLAAIPFSLSLSRKAQAMELRAEVDRLDQEAAGVRSQLRSATTRAQELLSELERSRALRGKRAWSSMFALIANCLPADCWLHSVATDPEAPGAVVSRPVGAPLAHGALASAETVTIEAPQKLRLIGFSTHDAQPLVFVSNLVDSRAFAHVALQKALRAPGGNEANEESLYQFEIVCEW